MWAAAASTEASEVTSISTVETVPLRGKAWRVETAEAPDVGLRLPRRTWYLGEARRRFLAASKPMPWLAPGRGG